MNRSELSSFIGITGFSLGQVEEDYFQHIVLSSISRRSAGDLVFKGGTAMQKMGFMERFSEDLDFTATGKIDIKKIMNDSTEEISGYNFNTSVDRVGEGEVSSGFRLRIEGPLFQGGKGLCTISIDISSRETVLLSPEAREYSPLYPTVSSYILATMNPEEILAEKIRALMTRRRPRDLYDASRLIERGFNIDRELVERKLKVYGISLDEERLLKRSYDLGRNWETELRQLLRSTPDHGQCLGIIEKALKEDHEDPTDIV